MNETRLIEFRKKMEEYVKAERERTDFAMSFVHSHEPGQNIMNSKIMTADDLKKLREMDGNVKRLEKEYEIMARELWSNKV